MEKEEEQEKKEEEKKLQTRLSPRTDVISKSDCKNSFLKIEKRNSKTKKLSRIAIISSLSFVFSLWKIPMLSTGGSISFVMVPIILLSVVAGSWEGISSGFLVGILKLILDSKKFGIIQMILDYPLAYSILGIAGLNLFDNIYISIFLACFLRYIVHVISGMIYFKASLVASMAFNGGYMFVESIITIIAIAYMDRKGYLLKLKKMI